MHRKFGVSGFWNPGYGGSRSGLQLLEKKATSNSSNSSSSNSNSNSNSNNDSDDGKVLHYFPGRVVTSSESSGSAHFNMRLAPPQLRALNVSQLEDLGIVIGDNNCIKKGFAKTFEEQLKTSCIHCRIIPLNNTSMTRLKGDMSEVTTWKNERKSHTYTSSYDGREHTYEYMSQTQRASTTETIDLTQSTTSQIETRKSSRPRKVVNYKETTTMEDDRTMRKEDKSGKAKAIVLEDDGFDELLCGDCRRIPKDTNTVEGFTHGKVLATSRAQYEYAATKGQLSRLPHVEKTWFGKPSKQYLRRHIIASTRVRFGSFAKMLERKKEKKTKAPRSIGNSKFMEKVWCDAQYGMGLCSCGMHAGYVEPNGDWCEGCGQYHDY